MRHRMLVLASQQPMANLLAACEPSFDIGEVHLIVSGDMEVGGVANRLATLLEARGLICRWHSVSEPFQPESTRGCVAGLLANEPSSWVVNITGGTKPMAIGAYRAALDCGARDIIYLDHDHGLLRWMDSEQPPVQVAARFTVTEMIGAHGYHVKPSKWPSTMRTAFAEKIFRGLLGSDRSTWNRLMSAVEEHCRSGQKWVAKPLIVPASEAIHTLLNEACRLQMCQFNGRELVISERDDHQFLAGGWFEAVVANALRRACPEILSDAQISVEVTSAEGAKNEIDVAAVLGQQLLVVECKSGAYWSNDKTAMTSYKLEHHKRLGGLGTRLMLVAIEKLDIGALSRMADANIAVVHDLSADNIGDRLETACNS